RCGPLRARESGRAEAAFGGRPRARPQPSQLEAVDGEAGSDRGGARYAPRARVVAAQAHERNGVAALASPTWRNLAVNVGLVAASLVFALGLSEVVVRVLDLEPPAMWQFTDTVGWLYQPGLRTWY